jgi:hypothetical protein
MPVRAAPADKTGYSICRDTAGDLEAMRSSMLKFKFAIDSPLEEAVTSELVSEGQFPVIEG